MLPNSAYYILTPDQSEEAKRRFESFLAVNGITRKWWSLLSEDRRHLILRGIIFKALGRRSKDKCWVRCTACDKTLKPEFGRCFNVLATHLTSKSHFVGTQEKIIFEKVKIDLLLPGADRVDVESFLREVEDSSTSDSSTSASSSATSSPSDSSFSEDEARTEAQARALEHFNRQFAAGQQNLPIAQVFALKDKLEPVAGLSAQVCEAFGGPMSMVPAGGSRQGVEAENPDSFCMQNQGAGAPGPGAWQGAMASLTMRDTSDECSGTGALAEAITSWSLDGARTNTTQAEGPDSMSAMQGLPTEEIYLERLTTGDSDIHEADEMWENLLDTMPQGPPPRKKRGGKRAVRCAGAESLSSPNVAAIDNPINTDARGRTRVVLALLELHRLLLLKKQQLLDKV